MGCNCSLTEKIIGALVIVFAWVTTGYNNWILTILGAALIYHAFKCSACNMPANAPVIKKAAKKKK